LAPSGSDYVFCPIAPKNLFWLTIDKNKQVSVPRDISFQIDKEMSLLFIQSRKPIWKQWELGSSPHPDCYILTFSLFCSFPSVVFSFERENVCAAICFFRVLSWSRWGLHQWQLRGRFHGSTFSSTGSWRLDLDRLGRRRVAALSFLFGWNLLNEAFHICLQFSTPHTIVTDAVRFMGLKFQRFA
jgi:hypothetical protein